MRTNFRNALAVFVLLTLCFAGQLRAEAKQPAKIKASAVEVKMIPSDELILPPEFQVSLYENLVEQLPTGEWIERATYFEAVAVTGDGVFETLRAVSKLVLKSLA